MSAAIGATAERFDVRNVDLKADGPTGSDALGNDPFRLARLRESGEFGGVKTGVGFGARRVQVNCL